MESKKLALLRILQILHMYSDIDHPLTQQKIGTLLVREYGIVLERKAIGRNLAFLREAGIDIAAFVQGCYLLDRLFEGSELRLLIDGVLSSKHISAPLQGTDREALSAGKHPFSPARAPSPFSEHTVRIGICVSPHVMFYWSLQYAPVVEVPSPPQLREQIRQVVRQAAEKYETGEHQT